MADLRVDGVRQYNIYGIPGESPMENAIRLVKGSTKISLRACPRIVPDRAVRRW
jgi:hypothetical protein